MLRSVLPALASALSIAGWIPPSEEPVISTDLYTWSVMAASYQARSARRVVGELLEHAEQLAHAADQQPLLVDLDPRARAGREDDVVARPDRHPDPCALPPIETRPDGEDDPVLRRRLVRSGGHEQPRLADAVGLELLDDDAIEKRAKVVAHFCVSTLRMGRAHAHMAVRLRPQRERSRRGLTPLVQGGATLLALAVTFAFTALIVSAR